MNMESMRTRSYGSFKLDDADLPAEAGERLSAIRRGACPSRALKALVEQREPWRRRRVHTSGLTRGTSDVH